MCVCCVCVVTACDLQPLTMYNKFFEMVFEMNNRQNTHTARWKEWSKKEQSLTRNSYHQRKKHFSRFLTITPLVTTDQNLLRTLKFLNIAVQSVEWVTIVVVVVAALFVCVWVCINSNDRELCAPALHVTIFGSPKERLSFLQIL